MKGRTSTIWQRSTLNSFLISGSDRTSKRTGKGSSINDWTCCLKPSQMLQSQQVAPPASRSLSRPSLLMDTQVPPWLDAAYPRHCFLSIIVLNLSYSCIAMAALFEASLRLARWNDVPVDTFSIFVQFCNQLHSHDRSIIAWSHLFWFPFCGRTGGCQTIHSCTLMI
jgi:hypothetical protein